VTGDRDHSGEDDGQRDRGKGGEEAARSGHGQRETGLRSKLHRCDLPGYGVVTPAEEESPEQPPAATHRLLQLVEFGLEPAALRVVGRRVQFGLLRTKCSFSSRTGIDDAGHAPKHCTAAPVDPVGGDRRTAKPRRRAFGS
jgi:hypothetical protein